MMPNWIRLEVFPYSRVGLISLMIIHVDKMMIRSLTFIIFLLKCAILMNIILLALYATIGIRQMHVLNVLWDESLGSRCLCLIYSICTWIYIW